MNKIANFAKEKNVGPVGLAKLLNISKGYASLLISGKKHVTPSVAAKLESITGTPWHTWIDNPNGVASAVTKAAA